MTYLAHSLFSLLILLCLGCSSFLESDNASETGTISGGTIIPNSIATLKHSFKQGDAPDAATDYKVELYKSSEPTTPIQQVTIDSVGRFVFNNVPFGVYDVISKNSTTGALTQNITVSQNALHYHIEEFNFYPLTPILINTDVRSIESITFYSEEITKNSESPYTVKAIKFPIENQTEVKQEIIIHEMVNGELQKYTLTIDTDKSYIKMHSPESTIIPRDTMPLQSYTNGDLTVSMYATYYTYDTKEPIEVTARVENIGTETLFFWGGPDSNNSISLFVNTKAGGDKFLSLPSNGEKTNAMLYGHSIAPGEKLTRTVIWDQRIFEYSEYLEIPDYYAWEGVYTIAAMFTGSYTWEPTNNNDTNNFVTITDTISVHINGTSAPLITDLEALDIVSNNVNVQSWLNDNPPSLCYSRYHSLKYSDNQWNILEPGQGRKSDIDKDLGRSCSIGFSTNNTWKFTISHLYDEEAGTIDATINAITGEFISHTFPAL